MPSLQTEVAMSTLTREDFQAIAMEQGAKLKLYKAYIGRLETHIKSEIDCAGDDIPCEYCIEKLEVLATRPEGLE